MKPFDIYHKNISVDYDDQGKGTALVLLHGFLENKQLWNTLVADWQTKFRVITIDLLGHGETGCLGYVHSMEDQADLVHTVLTALKIKKAVFAGHSMGGYVALAFAELFPSQVKGILLINSTSRADSDERKKNRDRAILAVKQNYKQFIRLSISNLFSEENRERFATAIETVREQAMQTPLQGVVAALEGMKIRKDREVLLHFGAYPIHLVIGDQDPVLPIEQALDQLDGTTRTFNQLHGGHMSPIENEAALRDIVLQFMKQV
ncbi:MAG: alpha/beta hydrolase [Flavobacterium sp. BFFFF2]|nr:MAG: alpha/beta hydrolase [Flavobacterium sp. BFFFF2]